jgi:predicted ABC-type ATPase
MKNKSVYIIAGPNGSGKTTFATKFLPDYVKCPHFVNADLIARGLSPFSPEIAAMKAGRIVLEQIATFASKGVDFGFETTMAGKTYYNLLEILKRQGYHLHLFFLWIPGPDLAIVRIQDRVAEGGHGVPSADVRRRFKRSLENFTKLYQPILDSWMLFNNTGSIPQLIAKKKDSHIEVIDNAIFEKIFVSGR